MAQNNYAIIRAAGIGRLDMVKWLHSVGCDPRAQDDLDIEWIIRNGYSELVEWLRSVGCQL
jgi:hypothetical protein